MGKPGCCARSRAYSAARWRIRRLAPPARRLRARSTRKKGRPMLRAATRNLDSPMDMTDNDKHMTAPFLRLAAAMPTGEGFPRPLLPALLLALSVLAGCA